MDKSKMEYEVSGDQYDELTLQASRISTLLLFMQGASAGSFEIKAENWSCMAEIMESEFSKMEKVIYEFKHARARGK